MAHGDDAMYFSKMNLKGQQLVVTENDKKIVDIYQKLITNFARYAFKYLNHASCQPDCSNLARILVSFFSQPVKAISKTQCTIGMSPLYEGIRILLNILITQPVSLSLALISAKVYN